MLRFRKKPGLFVLLSALIPPSGQSQPPLPAAEKLNYSVEWRLITAGKVHFEWNTATLENNPAWRTKVHLESTGMVSKLFKVNDDYTSTLTEDLCAVDSLLNAQEARRRRETRVSFDRAARKASYRETDLNINATVAAQEIDVPACVHDVFGALYLLRTMRMDPGQTVQIPVSDGKKSVSAKVEAQAREVVKTPGGSYKTIRYEAYLFNNVLYRRPAHLYIWLSDDARKLPVQIRVKMQFTIGTITLQLEKET
jgi:hypothetical protein